MPERSPTAEEIARFRKAGIEVGPTDVIDDKGNLLEGGPSQPPVMASTAVASNPSDNGGGAFGLIARQTARNALPAAVGGYAAEATSLLNLIPHPAAQIAGKILPFITGPVAGYFAKKLQTAGLKAAGSSIPASEEQDAKDYPYWSTAAALPSSVFAGGSAWPSVKNIIQAPGRAALMGAIQGGTDLATQKITNPEAPLDLKQSAIAALGGPLFAGKNHVSTAVSPGAYSKLTGSQTVSPESLPIHQRPGYNPAEILAATPDTLRDIAKTAKGKGDFGFYNALASLKDANVPVDDNTLERISSQGPGKGYDQVAGQIKAETLPKQDLINQQQAAAQKEVSDYATQKNAEEVGKLRAADTTVQPGQLAHAPESAEVIAEHQNQVDAENLARQKSTEEGLARAQSLTQANEPTVKSAEESARAIMAGQPNTLKTSLSTITKNEQAFNKLASRAEEYPEGSPERLMYTKALAQMRAELDATHERLLGSLAGAPERPAGVGLEEVVNPREQTPIEPPEETEEGPTPAAPQPRFAPKGPIEGAINQQQLDAQISAAKLPPKNEPPTPTTPQGETPPQNPQTPAKPVLPGKIGQVETTPVATKLESTKQTLGITPKPNQEKSVTPGGSSPDDIRNFSGYAGQTGKDVRGLIMSHPLYEKWLEGNPSMRGPDNVRAFFDKLDPKDQARIAHLYDLGAESWPKTMLTANADKLLAKKAGTPTVTGNKPLMGKVHGPVIPDAFSNQAYIQIKINRTSPKGVSSESVKGSVPENLRGSITNVERIKGNLIPTATGAQEGPASFRVHFKDVESAKAAHDYFSGKQPAIEQSKGLQVKSAQEAAAKKGGQSGSIPNPFRGPLGEATENAVEKIKGAAKDLGRSYLDDIASAKEKLGKLNPISFLANSSHALKSAYKVASEADPVLGPRFANGVNKAEIDSTAFDNKQQAPIEELTKGLSNEDSHKITSYLDERYYGNKPAPLEPRLQTIAEQAQALAQNMRPKDAPWVSEIVNGVLTERPVLTRPDMFPQIASRDAINILRGGGDKAAQLREDIINWNRQRGSSDPEKEYLSKFAPEALSTQTSSEFAGLRRPEGLGLPPSMREPDLRQRLLTYANRIGKDYGWHKNIELDPALAKGLNYKTNGKGVETPTTVLDETGRAVKTGVLAENQGVRDVIKEYVGSTDHEAREFEKLRNWATVPLLGPVSRARHVLIAQNALRDVMSPSENHLFAQAAKNLFDGYEGARQQSLEAGSQRYSRNINPAMAVDMMDKVSSVLEGFSRITGAEKVSQVGMTFIDQTARLLAETRIAKGDAAFFDKFGPNDWRQQPMEDVVNHVAANLTRISWGTYTGKDLPAWLARGSTSKAWAPFFALSRAPIGRFNSWVDNVYTPATQGNLTPMLHSMLGAALTAGAINFIKEEITGKKPPELTWEEWLRLGGKDTTNMLFSKAATAGYAGVLSELALYASEFYHNEPVQGFNSPTFILEDNTIKRVAQFVNAWRLGETDLGGLGDLGIQLLRDQIQVVRQALPNVERGAREERIAKRLGYIAPSENVEEGLAPANPFSANQAYLRGDVDQARRNIQARMSRGQMPSEPSSEVRQGMMLMPDRKIGTYYDFIKQAQGDESSKAAMRRDLDNTMKKYKTFSTAISR